MSKLPGLVSLLVVSIAAIILGFLADDPIFLQTMVYVAVAILLVPSIFGFLYSMIYHRRQQLSFHETHVEAEQGVFFRQHFFACYRNVKKTVLTQYPRGDIGKLKIFVAGEQEAIKGRTGAKNSKGSIPMPCSFTSGFLPAIEKKRRLIDDILSARVLAEPNAEAAPEPFEMVAEGSRTVGNSVTKTLLFGLIPLFTVALPFTLPFAIIGAKRWKYRVESGRVVVTWGILFRSQASILLDRVDSIRHYQGPLNKIFKNGSIDLMTAGSSLPDLTIANSPDYLELYQEIRSRSSSAK